MENLSEETKQALNQLAFNQSVAFCYHCYISAPTGCCSKCHSDDLMRMVPGIGVEYGTDWVLAHLVSANVTYVNTEETFSQYMHGCYEETVKIGWIEYDILEAIKKLDPLSYEMAQSEWIDSEVSEGNLVTFDGGASYVWLHDLESFIEEMSEVKGT